MTGGEFRTHDIIIPEPRPTIRKLLEQSEKPMTRDELNAAVQGLSGMGPIDSREIVDAGIDSLRRRGEIWFDGAAYSLRDA